MKKIRLKNMELVSEKNNKKEFRNAMFNMTVFEGQGHYRPWVELYGIKKEFLDTNLEKEVIETISNALGQGESFFIEYYYDPETTEGLIKGFPPATTRLGFMLFEQGFTWFKDWYFSEGWSEGGQKLQGEKSTGKNRERQLKEIKKQAEEFLEKKPASDLIEKALERAEKITKN